MERSKKVIGLTLAGLALANTTFAQVSVPSNPGGLRDLSGGGGVGGFALWVIMLLLGIVGIVSVLFIIIGGFQYVLSGANEDLAKRGKTTLTNAVIGLVIVILSYTIIRVVVTTFF